MVLALVGDSTMTRAGRPSRARVGTPFFLARLTFWARADSAGAEALAELVLRSGALRPVPSRLLGAFFPFFPDLLFLVAIIPSVSTRLISQSSREVARNPHLRAKCKADS